MQEADLLRPVVEFQATPRRRCKIRGADVDDFPAEQALVLEKPFMESKSQTK